MYFIISQLDIHIISFYIITSHYTALILFHYHGHIIIAISRYIITTSSFTLLQIYFTQLIMGYITSLQFMICLFIIGLVGAYKWTG